MDFPYLKVLDFPNHQKRERFLPWIRFGVFNPNNKLKQFYPVGLVDSGSEVSFIDHEIGEELGFNITKGTPVEVTGVGGGKIKIYLHLVGIELQTNNNSSSIIFEDYIGFTLTRFPPSMPQQTAILGSIGFFRNLNITFKYPHVIKIDASIKLKVN